MAANNIILNGRVEVDPNLVPRAAGMGSAEESTFARVLDSTEDRQRAAEGSARRDRTADTRSEEPEQGNPEPTRTEQDRGPANQTEGRTAAADAAEGADESAPSVLGPATPDRGESVRPRLEPLARSKGADSPAHPVLREVGIPSASSLSDGGDLNPSGQVAAFSLAADAKGAAAGANTNQVGHRIAGLDAARASESTAGARSASRPGFRTFSPQLLQAAEQARDSVFRQIVFRMHGESSEMRVLLDPPELGQLDLNMVVDKAGVMQLSITTERPEMAFLLDKHMAELRQVLSQHGLEVAHADVQTRSDDQSNDESDASMSRDNADSDADASAVAHGGSRSGYITADGLDFWV